ncbi:MAG TPA: RNB domain-containing ribonuclease [Anaerolinea thermolimosa]|uniref:RNB domain-containing ribonuclease n=1 Tax=Anaerolinea thermolimosa TaxID=229919 RepID=A0A3D1JDR6_9CHLR|nr:RNB domain-containing ribonuclease [Anaerolinea thermolimosa]GAP07631.1 exoribonuclease R [Anaerolinea thermolimosa]HCE16643.1 RNB domain-containing ribonuclease [Anaerolinea thermolimosa]
MTESEKSIRPGALVLYRKRAARVVQAGEKLEIDLNGERLRVRAKDVELLHPGPVETLSELRPLPGEMRAAWEILAGTTTTLAELAELAFGEYTPATAWAAWQFVAEGLYFTGTPASVRALTFEEVQAQEAERAAREAEERAWGAFLERARRGERSSSDERFYKEVEQMALGSISRCRVLRELGRAETPENAHALLLELGIWNATVNPHPRRLRLPLSPPDLPLPDLPDEPRVDLTHLPAYAIDDKGSDTPDDAISLDGNRLWVHVADVAAIVTPGSALDVEAQNRGETLHLPEGITPLFPPEMTIRLGLGIQPVSPALSFGIELDAQGGISGVEILPSWVKVTRLSYEEANLRMDEVPFRELEERLNVHRELRLMNGAVEIDLPEVKIHVDSDGMVIVDPVRSLRSRRMVEEAMILTGEATARFALQYGLAMPFSVQEEPEARVPHDTLVGMFAMRRYLKRSQYRAVAGGHSGLGLSGYIQATSPLRRYLDVVAHQQLRAYLKGEHLLGESEILERIGMLEAVLPALRQAEVLSERHWTLVYLCQHPDWKGRAVLVERRGATEIWLIPDLALEARAHLGGGLEVGEECLVEVRSIDLPNLEFFIGIAT